MATHIASETATAAQNHSFHCFIAEVAVEPNRRLDGFTSMVVEDALELLRAHGTRYAAEYMEMWSVPFDVAHRVLVLKQRRVQ